MKTAPTSIVITGASGGLGRALVRQLAGPGRTMLLAGRDRERLDQASDDATARGAATELCTVPLEHGKDFAMALRDFDSRFPVDLVMANAGIKTGNRNGVEPEGQAARTVNVNLLGAMATVEALLPAMRGRRHGRLLLVSSLAAVSPQPDLLSYSATKAAIRAYGIALRRNLHGTGVVVSIATPGFIDTPMTERHIGPTPFVVSADRAAQDIVHGLMKGRRGIVVPRRLGLLVTLEQLLPGALGDRICQAFRAQIVPDEDERSLRSDT